MSNPCRRRGDGRVVAPESGWHTAKEDARMGKAAQRQQSVLRQLSHAENAVGTVGWELLTKF